MFLAGVDDLLEKSYAECPKKMYIHTFNGTQSTLHHFTYLNLGKKYCSDIR